MMTLQYTSDSLIGTIDLPASKSISNRVLMIQALCDEFVDSLNLSEAHDTVILSNLLVEIKNTQGKIILDVEDAGTPFRFLTAYLAMQEAKEFIITGSERLCERPIHPLVDALQFIGADIHYTNKKGFAPLLIKGKKLKGAALRISGDISSQFISALCLIAPCLENGLMIEILNEQVSDSYIQITLTVMKEFGIQSIIGYNFIHIPQQKYAGRKYAVENDWSSATFFYAMAMLIDNVEIKLNGLHQQSVQGDSFIQIIANDFGIETNFEHNACTLKRIAPVDSSFEKGYNLSSFPDLAIPFIVACAIKYPNVRIRGIHHVELKESKRITSLQTELKKVNIHLLYEQDVLTFHHSGDMTPREITFSSYNDHRIVMALSMLTLKGYAVTFDNTDCVKKSFPDFFNQIKRLGIMPLIS